MALVGKWGSCLPSNDREEFIDIDRAHAFSS